MRSPGIILPGSRPFHEIIRPLSVEVAPCFWLIDDQQNPFGSTWLWASPENEAIVERKHFDAPACRDTSASCWRPFTFPRLAKHVIVDECTYFFAMRCPKEDVSRRAVWIVPEIGKFTGEFFSYMDENVDLFLMQVDGWWELYTSHAEWRRKFRESFPESYERSWRMAGEPPARSI